MALRGAGKPIQVDDWKGLNSFASATNIQPEWWNASSNVIVTNDGSAACLRSPANFNTALSDSNLVLSAYDYAKNSGHLILFDENTGSIGASSVRTYSTTGGANTTVRSNQAPARWKSATINDMCYRLNGTEFVQTDGTNTYAVGITAPAAAPTLSFVAGGTGSIAVGVTVSYAYRNSATKHVSPPSPVSASSGASTGGSSTLRIAVTASTQTGVDGIVLNITEDGGSVRYLYVDTSGDPVVNSNSTGNIDISIALLANLDTLTPETVYNSTPPQNAFFMFKWRKRLCLLDFRGATTRQQIQFNTNENCYYGIPWESWFESNILTIPNKSDSARSGIETPIGALILGEMDSYLIRGSLTDIIDSPNNPIALTVSAQPMNWSIGTKSPYTLVATPYGNIWLDQNKRIQLWDQQGGFPIEIGLPIRTSLDDISDVFAARNMAEAVWFQHGKDGGHYILSASTNGDSNNILFILSVYRDPEDGQMHTACAVSDIAAQCIFTAEVSGNNRCFIGVTDRLREIMDLEMEGAGWGASQTRYFSTVLGNRSTFSYWSTIKFDTTNATGLSVTISNLDGTDSKQIELDPLYEEGGGGRYYGRLDDYGFRKVLTFTFNSSDTAQRVIQNLQVDSKPTARLM